MHPALNSILLAAVGLCLCTSAQAEAPVFAKGYKPARNSDGTPDLNGVWGYVTITPFERQASFGDRLVMTPEEAAAAEGKVKAVNDLASSPTDPNLSVKDLPADCSAGRGKSCNYNAAWTDPGTLVMRVAGKPRTSVLTTPDGRIPLNLAGKRPTRINEGEEQNSGSQTRAVAPPDPPGMNDNPEGRSLSERCLLFGSQVIQSGIYNNNIAIQQGGDTVAIESEMIHDVRLVHLKGKYAPGSVKPWMGDSVGWYEGATLVVETTNYNPKHRAFYGSSDKLKITERFTRVAPDRLHYSFQIEDPKVWAKPWGGEEEFFDSHAVYEYACHEGNYGLENILAGARAEEERAKPTASR